MALGGQRNVLFLILCAVAMCRTEGLQQYSSFIWLLSQLINAGITCVGSVVVVSVLIFINSSSGKPLLCNIASYLRGF